MDDIDKTQALDDIRYRANLSNSKRDTGNAIATGECLFCEAHLPPGLRWCGPECRDDWQKDQNRL